MSNGSFKTILLIDNLGIQTRENCHVRHLRGNFLIKRVHYDHTTHTYQPNISKSPGCGPGAGVKVVVILNFDICDFVAMYLSLLVL